MRKCRQYSKEFKEKLLAKVFSPNAPGVVELARKAGIPYPTLRTWIEMSKKKPIQTNSTHSSKNRAAEAKLQAVSDTLKMTETEKGAYCRQHGFYTHELNEWKAQMLSDIHSPKEQKSENRQYI